MDSSSVKELADFSAPRWTDFSEFTQLMVETKDLDPISHVLKHLADEWCIGLEGRVMMTLLFLAYDHFGSFLYTWHEHGFPGYDPVEDSQLGLPTSRERRGHRSKTNLKRHLEYLGARTKWGDYLCSFLGPDKQKSWVGVCQALRSIPGNGRWIGYKGCEMLVTVAGFPMEAPNCDHANSSGPLNGLSALVDDVHPGLRLPTLDRATNRVLDALHADGVSVKMHDLESTFCDWYALTEGRYFVGHDWAAYREEATWAEGKYPKERQRIVDHAFWTLRPHDFANASTDDKRLKTLYRDTGVLRWWEQ